MNAKAKTKAQLIHEVAELRQKVTDLKDAETALKTTEEALRTHQIELETANAELRAGQLELRASRKKYLDLYDFAPVGYCTVDPAGRILEANLTAARLFGIERGRLIETRLYHYLVDHDRDRFFLYLRQLADAATPQTCDLRLLTPDGAERWAQFDAIIFAEHQYRIAISDITARKQAEETIRQSHDQLEALVNARTAELRQEIAAHKQTEAALRESEGKFYSAFHFNPMVMSLSTLTEGRFLDVNDAFLNMAERPRDEVIGHTSLEIQAWSSLEQREQILSRLSAHGTVRDVEVTVRAKSGKRHEVLWSAEYLVINGEACLLAAAVDITERKQTEAALRESQANLQAVFENSLQSFLLIGPDHAIHLFNSIANERAQAVFGKTMHIGDPIYGYVRAEDREAFEHDFARALNGEHVSVEKAFPLLTGKRAWFEFQYSPVLDARGSVMGVFFVSQEITERKQIEEALRATEAQLREVLENSLDASYKRNLQTDSYEYLSPVFARISGYTPAEMKTLPLATVLALIHPADLADTEGVLARSMTGAAGAAYRVEYRFKHKEGPYRWLCDQFTVMRAADGQPLARVGSVSDITDRKRMEDALHETEARFALFMDYLPAVVFIKDAESRVLYINKYMNAVLGAKDWVGTTVLADFPKELAEAMLADDQKALSAGYQETVETVPLLDGTAHIYQTRKFAIPRPGQSPLLGGIALDITARKQAEEALQASEVRYRRLFESAKDGILILEAETGRILDVNPFLCELLRFSRDAFCGKHLWELGFFKDIVANQANFAALQQQEYLRYEDLPLETADGRRIDVEFVSNVYLVNGHKVIQCNIRDITARKQAEDALRAADRELLAKNIALHEANASKDKFFSIIAHDLRSPFNGLLGYLDIMGRQFDDLSPNKLKDYLAKLKRSANALHALLENLLAWALMQRGLVAYRPEVLALAPLADELAALFAANARQKAITLTQAVPAAVLVSADMAMLNTILRNLVSNALKFTPAGGRITISARAVAEDVEIAVTDTGGGMTPDVIARLFRLDSHHTTKGTADETGTGLGLLLCHDLVRKHGGALTVESAVGAGATFRFTLPLAGTAAAPEPPAASEAAPFDFAQGDTGILTRLTAPLPPAQTLETLLAFAEIGDILELRNALDALAQEAPLIPFVSGLSGLAEQFKLDAIRQLLEGYLAQVNEEEATSGQSW